MAAVTSAVVAAGGLALSARQYIQQENALQDTQDASTQFAQEFLNVEATNKLKALQVPKLATELQMQEKGRAMTAGLENLQQQGATGAHTTTDLVQASNEQDLKIAADIQKEEARINELIAKQDQNIEDTRAADEKSLAMMRVKGAGEAASELREGMRDSATDIASGVGGLGTSLYAAQGLYNLDGSQINVG